MQYAGAYRPMILIRGNKLFEYKGDKMPVGFHCLKTDKFTNNVIDIETDDIIYLFTDGISDQFGYNEIGEHCKFTNYRMLQLLLSISDRTFIGQEGMLQEALNKWRTPGAKGKISEQIDDQLLVGIRI